MIPRETRPFVDEVRLDAVDTTHSDGTTHVSRSPAHDLSDVERGLASGAPGRYGTRSAGGRPQVE